MPVLGRADGGGYALDVRPDSLKHGTHAISEFGNNTVSLLVLQCLIVKASEALTQNGIYIVHTFRLQNNKNRNKTFIVL